ncbi:hypothetical protein A33Q_1096 [Indibacter alkaliphilus LW1]|uniref:Uncharacterized protein n=1 Tax=Indibacter alkaliphilus (strain CCUG 57479 / KCTC 22604 / LW1) TaxID=1189612 RepID=S2DHF4_INDAL|nr:hypothetical protein A33Q_1096 [Indibacter alkaliphilus LW1]
MLIQDVPMKITFSPRTTLIYATNYRLEPILKLFQINFSKFN